MTEFELTTEQVAIRDLAAKVAADFEVPNERWDREGIFPRDEVKGPICAAGFAAMTIPEEYGGGDASYADFILVLEQFARISMAAAFFLLSTCSGPIDFIVKFGNKSLKERYLRKLAAGDVYCAMAMSEPDAGSDVGSIRTRAVIEGDRIRINGAKIWVGGGGDADMYVVFVRMNDAAGVAGLGSVIVDKDAPGLKFGSRFRMMGTRTVPRCEVLFEDCIIPVENILTEPGTFGQMIEVFNGERIHNACLGLGIAQGAYEHAAGYAKERVQFNKRLVDFQGIQWKLADMEMLLEACRLLVYRAARAKDAGHSLGRFVSQAKLFSATYCPQVCDQALQIEGAFGYSEGSRVARAYRDVRMVPLAAGSTEMMKNYLGGLHAR
jgi:butyryl-CoA dehydrogenase